MELIVYSTPSHPLSAHIQAQMKVEGHEVRIRSFRHYQGEVESCDFVIVIGFREPARRVVDKYEESGKSCLVIDWGYFCRVNEPNQKKTGYWQISPHKLNNPPSFDCPYDRLNSSGLKISGKFKGDKDGHVLICGQMPQDAAVHAHNHKEWLTEQVDHYGNDATYREHPRGGVKLSGVRLDIDSLKDALGKARVVVTWNSNVGHEALAEGVPVICDSCAPYSELSGEKLPTLARRKAYFSRAAYGQWLWDEMAKGIAFTIDNISQW